MDLSSSSRGSTAMKRGTERNVFPSRLIISRHRLTNSQSDGRDSRQKGESLTRCIPDESLSIPLHLHASRATSPSPSLPQYVHKRPFWFPLSTQSMLSKPTLPLESGPNRGTASRKCGESEFPEWWPNLRGTVRTCSAGLPCRTSSRQQPSCSLQDRSIAFQGGQLVLSDVVNSSSMLAAG